MRRCPPSALVLILCTLSLTSCGRETSRPGGERPNVTVKGGGPARGVKLSVVSGSENKALEPILKKFGADNGIDVQVTYMGSVDISRELAKGPAGGFDAFWPAASLWISLGDTQHQLKHAKSILRSPVVFAVLKSKAKQLGWTAPSDPVGLPTGRQDRRDVKVMDILKAAQDREIRFAMTSATQSNSGASAYLGYLSAFAGSPEVLTKEDLEEPEVRQRIKEFLGRVDRSVGSSGWLMEMMVDKYGRYDAMVNYEALVIEANQKLVQQGKEPFYAVYPVDGLAMADSPLAYMDKGDAKKEKAFLALQEHLLSDGVQQQLLALGRRTGLAGLTGKVDEEVFNPAWGIDPTRVITPVRVPSGEVVREALELYQVAFRKPSLTAFVLDYSGSMRGPGERQLEEAMRTLLEPKLAEQYLLQPSPEDVTVVVPFNSEVTDVWTAEGNDARELRGLLDKIEDKGAGGGTNMYKAAEEAFRRIKDKAATGKYHVSVIVMSDGRSDGSLQDLLQSEAAKTAILDVPVYTILFGDADPAQMQALAEAGSGRMFDGRKDVVQAFREAKGYN